MVVFQATFVERATSHKTGGVPEATPLASGPRNDGQFCACGYRSQRDELSERGLEKRRKK